MKKRLSAIGNSLGIVIEKPILELLKIDRDTELDLSTDGDRLIIRPVRRSRRNQVAVLTSQVMLEHEETLRKLAK